MALLLAVGLVLTSLALVPGFRRFPLLLALAVLFSVVVARTLTDDGFLVVAAGVLPLLVGLLAREMGDAFGLLAAAKREERRVSELERRRRERAREARERDRRRQQRAA